MSKKVYCTPTCKYFQCTGNHLSVKFTRQGKRLVTCKWAGDLCIGYKCKFASCKINKLLSDGTCALKTKREAQKTKDYHPKYEAHDEFENIPLKSLEKRIKSKDLKKLKKWDLYY
ncbi:MAG: hypothetical protein ACP6IS_04890 [Candidatus Asgardarchaeia archaeon]